MATEGTAPQDGQASRGFLRDVLLYLPAQVVPALVGVVTIPVVTSLFSPSEYGLLSLALATIAIAVTLIGWVPTAVIRFYPIAVREGTRNSFLATVQSLMLILVVGACLVGAVLLLMGRQTLPAGLEGMLWIGLGILATDGLFTTYQHILRSRQRAASYSLFSVLKSVGNLGIGVLLVVGFGLGIQGFLWGALLTTILVLPLAWRRAVGRESGLSLRLDRDLSWDMARYGFPLVIANVAGWVLNLSDRYILDFMRGTHEVGVYAVSYDVGARSAMLVVMLFGLALGPMAMRIWEQEGEERTRLFLRDVTRYYLIVALVAVTGMAVLSEPLMVLMSSSAYHEGHRILGMIGAGVFFLGLQGIFQVGLLVHKRTMPLTLALIATAALNLVLNLLLVPTHGYMAAAATTLIAYVALLVIVTVMSRSYLVWPFPFASLVRVAAACALMAVFLALVVLPMPVPAWVRIVTGASSGLVVYGAALLLLGEIRAHEKDHVRRVLRRFLPGSRPPD